MGGCAKNGKDGTDGKEDSALQLGLIKMGLDKKIVERFKISKSKTYYKVFLSNLRPFDEKLREESKNYWDDLIKREIADSLITFEKESLIVLQVDKIEKAKKIIQDDPIIKSGAFEKVTYRRFVV